jgi:hypothetical protein
MMMMMMMKLDDTNGKPTSCNLTVVGDRETDDQRHQHVLWSLLRNPSSFFSFCVSVDA